MKKITLLFSAVLIFTLSFYSCEQSQLDPSDPEATELEAVGVMNAVVDPQFITPCGEQICILKAGKNGENVGSVTVSNDGSNLYVTVVANDGFQATAEYLKIWILTSEPDHRPSNEYQFKTDQINSGNSVTFQIPYQELIDLELLPDGDVCPQKLYIVAHVDAGEDDTAFGGCDDGGHNGQAPHSWFSFIEYDTECCECWCGFGNDYQREEADPKACKVGKFNGEDYIFWSNEFNFKKVMENNDYTISLLANPSICVPQKTDGSFMPGESGEIIAEEVGHVVLHAFVGDGSDGYEKDKRYVNVTYTINPNYVGHNTQLDLYNGIDRVPPVDLINMKILTEEGKYMLYQKRLTPGDNTYTFTIPWLTHENSQNTYLALHAAIGDCPMPGLQSNETGASTDN